MDGIENAIYTALLYFDFWRYPLTAEELFAFLPCKVLSLSEFKRHLRTYGPGPNVAEESGYFFLSVRAPDVVTRRKELERRARKMWWMARVSTSVSKRFPFIRAVMVSGELSKNLALKGGDVDFFVITSPNHLWIARALLILFKKVFLLNRKKFFCLNTFITTDRLLLDEKNIYAAAEIAYLKPIYNLEMFRSFQQANSWILDFFPNFDRDLLPSPELRVSERRSMLQKIREYLFDLVPSDSLDTRLLRAMKRVWERRYPDGDDAKHARSFRSTKTESRMYPLDYQDLVLAQFTQRKETAFSSMEGKRNRVPIQSASSANLA